MCTDKKKVVLGDFRAKKGKLSIADDLPWNKTMKNITLLITALLPPVTGFAWPNF